MFSICTVNCIFDGSFFFYLVHISPLKDITGAGKIRCPLSDTKAKISADIKIHISAVIWPFFLEKDWKHRNQITLLMEFLESLLYTVVTDPCTSRMLMANATSYAHWLRGHCALVLLYQEMRHPRTRVQEALAVKCLFWLHVEITLQTPPQIKLGFMWKLLHQSSPIKFGLICRSITRSSL